MEEWQNGFIWGERRVVREYGAAEGFLDDGERIAFTRVAAEACGQSVLDLGVGGGRTVPLLQPLASSYVALDYTPEMVELCSQRFPELAIQYGDARDLTQFPDGTFGLVAFSFNGIDAMDHGDRKRVLSEAYRVLRPGGRFWFSTLNQGGIGLRMRPWVPEWPSRRDSALRFAVRTLRVPLTIARRIRNYLRVKPRFRVGDGWCTGTLSAHEYRLVMHYTSLSRELLELAQVGFAPDPMVLDHRGELVSVEDDLSQVFWFQIITRKPGH